MIAEVHVVSHPMRQIGVSMAYEVTRDMPAPLMTIETPLETRAPTQEPRAQLER